jgi:hypothetical protein
MSNPKSDQPPQYTPISQSQGQQYGSFPETHQNHNEPRTHHSVIYVEGVDPNGPQPLQDNPPHSFDIAWGCFLMGFIVPIAWVPGFFYGIRSIHRSARIFGLLNIIMITIFLTFAGYK